MKKTDLHTHTFFLSRRKKIMEQNLTLSQIKKNRCNTFIRGKRKNTFEINLLTLNVDVINKILFV